MQNCAFAVAIAAHPNIDMLTQTFLDLHLVSTFPARSIFSSVTSKSGVKSNIKPPPPPPYQVLDTHTFDEVALVRPNLVIRVNTISLTLYV